MARDRLFSLLVSGAVLAASTAWAAQPTIYTPGDGLAVTGYDPVAYFTESRPVEGSAEHSLDWQGATWHFATAESRDRFKADPERYAPQFGGYCAWAVSQGYTASADPQAWKIVDGKLYLNYSLDVQKTWEQDVPGNIAKGEANWPAVLEK